MFFHIRTFFLGVVMFQDPVNSGLAQLLWARCKNCSIFTGVPTAFPCVYALGNGPGGVGPWTPMWYNYVTGGNATPPPFPEVDAILVAPQESYFEYLTPRVGYPFQVLFSLWAGFNLVLASIFIANKVKLKPKPMLVSVMNWRHFHKP